SRNRQTKHGSTWSSRIELRKLPARSNVKAIDVRAAVIAGPKGSSILVERDREQALLAGSGVCHHLLPRGVEANDVGQVANDHASVGNNAQHQRLLQTSSERRHLLIAANVIAQNRLPFRCIEQRAVVGGEVNIVASLPLGCDSEGL